MNSNLFAVERKNTGISVKLFVMDALKMNLIHVKMTVRKVIITRIVLLANPKIAKGEDVKDVVENLGHWNSVVVLLITLPYAVMTI